MSRDGDHNGLLKVDDWKHYEKTHCVACYFNVGPASFNKITTSTTCWHLHMFEKQISRWPVVQFTCHVITCSEIWAYHHRNLKTMRINATWKTSRLLLQKKVHQLSDAHGEAHHFFFFFLTSIESFIDPRTKMNHQFQVLLCSTENFVRTYH